MAVTLAALFGIGTIAYANFLRLQQTKAWVNHTHEVSEKLVMLLSTLKDAETGQRGYLLTGDAEYLQPYESAISAIELIPMQPDLISVLSFCPRSSIDFNKPIR